MMYSSFVVAMDLLFSQGWKAFFEEPIMLIAFVLLGRNLEQRAKLKAASDMTGLMSILPTKARLLIDKSAEEMPVVVEVPCNSLSVGDQIVVLPGDRVPADGVVRAGRSTVDESSFTGEPLPVTKIAGSDVTAGSINLNGTLTVEVRRQGGQTVMSDIVRLVEEAQSREAPVQRLADKVYFQHQVSGHFTYGVMALSAATFMFWSTIGSKVLPAALQQGSAISLALQLSCSVLVGTSLGATRGLLLRGGDILEKFALADTVVFDKTGTLTVGKPVVTKVVAFGYEEEKNSRKVKKLIRTSTIAFVARGKGEKRRNEKLVLYDEQKRLWPNSNDKQSEVEVLRLAAGVEMNTIHPVGKAIMEAARAAGCQNAKVSDGTFREEPGSGTIAVVDQKKVSVGNIDWLRRHGVDRNSFPDVEEYTNQSVVYVGVDGALAGLIYFEDMIREDARDVVESLSKQGIDTYMLSGDKKHTAEYVASVVGIPKEKVLSGVKPDEKKAFISELQKDKKVVAMVGDGINDAAALASSNIGIAMGGGVGAASEVSSIVLMGNRLSQLLDSLELSKLTMKTIQQNLWWAFAYNIVGIPIAAGIMLPFTGTMLTPSIAGAFMGLSSMGVMMNSLLLRLKFQSKQKSVEKVLREIRVSSDHGLLLDKQRKWEKDSDSAKWGST
ncbi:Polyamine N-acetyltransferase 1 [Asimina triloba]